MAREVVGTQVTAAVRGQRKQAEWSTAPMPGKEGLESRGCKSRGKVTEGKDQDKELEGEGLGRCVSGKGATKDNGDNS